MALDPGAMHARIIENLPEKSGHSLKHWLDLLAKGPKDKRAQMALLKSDHGIGHHTAGAIIREFNNDVPWRDGNDLETKLIGQLNAGSRSLYDTLKSHALGMTGVQLVQCKTYTGFKAKRQFAIVTPSKTDGLRVGLALPIKDHPALRPAKSLGSARITAMVQADASESVMKELLGKAAEADQTSRKA